MKSLGQGGILFGIALIGQNHVDRHRLGLHRRQQAQRLRDGPPDAANPTAIHQSQLIDG